MPDESVRFTDPTGHMISDGCNIGECGGNNSDLSDPEQAAGFLYHYLRYYGIDISVPSKPPEPQSYSEWWTEWYLPRMGDYFIDDVATIAQTVADPLNLGLDAYENWRVNSST